MGEASSSQSWVAFVCWIRSLNDGGMVGDEAMVAWLLLECWILSFFLWREIHLKYVDFSDALSRPVRILEVPGPGTPPRGTVEVRGPPFGVSALKKYLGRE